MAEPGESGRGSTLFGRLPLPRVERWSRLDAILRAWFPAAAGQTAFDAADLHAAEARLRLQAPCALREWYERTAARTEVWSLQDRLLSPDQWYVESGVLVFVVENQGVVRWGIRVSDTATDDPAVMVSDPDGGQEWLLAGATTSAFAIQFAVLNAKWSDAIAHRANGAGSDELFAAIAERYPRLPFPDLNWPTSPTRLYGHDDLILENSADTWLWVSARTDAALDEIADLARATGAAWEDMC